MDNILVHIYTVHQSHPFWPICRFVSSTCTGLFFYWFSICTTNYMKNILGTHVACCTALTHSKEWQPLKCDYTKKCDQIKTDRCRTKWSCKVALLSTGNMKKKNYSNSLWFTLTAHIYIKQNQHLYLQVELKPAFTKGGKKHVKYAKNSELLVSNMAKTKGQCATKNDIFFILPMAAPHVLEP